MVCLALVHSPAFHCRAQQVVRGSWEEERSPQWPQPSLLATAHGSGHWGLLPCANREPGKCALAVFGFTAAVTGERTGPVPSRTLWRRGHKTLVGQTLSSVPSPACVTEPCLPRLPCLPPGHVTYSSCPPGFLHIWSLSRMPFHLPCGISMLTESEAILCETLPSSKEAEAPRV